MHLKHVLLEFLLVDEKSDAIAAVVLRENGPNHDFRKYLIESVLQNFIRNRIAQVAVDQLVVFEDDCVVVDNKCSFFHQSDDKSLI